MNDNNPYAAPKSNLEPVYLAEVIPRNIPPGVWRHGHMLVMTSDASLPYRCVLTNQPATFLDQTMIVALRHPIQVPLSQDCIDSGIGARRFAMFIMAGGLGCAIAGAVLLLERRVVAEARVVGLVLIVLGLIVAAVSYGGTRREGPRLQVEKMTEELLWISGADPGYLSHLPEWPYGESLAPARPPM